VRARTALQLIRVETTIVVFLSVFLPILVRSGSLRESAMKGAPLLFICICTWLANDLNDRERDKINHPERPLALGSITPEAAAVVYFISLAASLITTRYCVPSAVAFWYYLILFLALSYGYVVELLPTIKAFYVSVAIALPVIIVESFYPTETKLFRIGASVFLFSCGKELCMDILDRPGDPTSLLHQLEPHTVAAIAFGLEIAAVVPLALTVTGTVARALLGAICCIIVLAFLAWRHASRRRFAVALMRLPMLLGLYFLV
jgi:geranylgeranylglycerol-phosphate geranylgeranyltransferase